MSQLESSSESAALVRLIDEPPTVLPVVVLADLVPFPGPIVPLLLDDEPRREAVLHAKNNSGFFFLVNRRRDPRAEEALPGSKVVPADTSDIAQEMVGDSETDMSQQEEFEQLSSVETPTDKRTLSLVDINPMGIVGRLVKVVRLPDERLSALVHLMRRAQPTELLQQDPFVMMRVLCPIEVVADEERFAALYRQVRLNLHAFFEAHPTVSDELKVAALSIESPNTVADFVAQHLSRDFQERLSFLNELDLSKRMLRALEVTIRELDLLTVGNRISQEIRDKVEKHQRDFLLREQLKAIRGELGEEKDPVGLAITELRDKLDKAGLSDTARARANEELKRLQLLPSESPEHHVVRSYIELIASLPWSTYSEDTHDLVRARAVLDEDHYGLEEVKERLLEFLAVHQLNPNKVGTLLCFAGPPGVGKTSLGQSIARALGRKFYRFSVGGMRDEAEIKGHRRTYIGAMPGRVLQGLRQVQSANPVFMLDELDKIGNDWRGDPSSALLEVLDPAQNKAFVDYYLDLPFDLSRIMFIATVNIATELPHALRDRLEIIELPGYTPEEKQEIALRYLVPRQRQEHGLQKRQLQISKSGILRVVTQYTHEAGVRELNRLIGKICRKRAMAVVLKQDTPAQARVGTDEVARLLGPAKNYDDRLTGKAVAGVVVGLAWTPVGGDVLYIETVAMEGKGAFQVTGHLGEVMNESAKIAMSYVRKHAKELGIDTQAFRRNDFHLHFPAGAVRKDGPSAGITVTTALISLLIGQAIKPRLAMTGEMTLSGEVLPVGGIREKVIAALRAGVKTVIMPYRNKADVDKIPDEIREQLTFVYAKNYATVLEMAFVKPPHVLTNTPAVELKQHAKQKLQHTLLKKVASKTKPKKRRVLS